MGSIAPTSVQPRFLVIGAGSRGEAYARAVTASTDGIIAAVAEPDYFKRQEFGRKYIWHDAQPTDGQSFSDWQDFVDWENKRRASPDSNYKSIDGVFICTLDETHVTVIKAIAHLNLHIMCEKPLALSMADCLMISNALKPYPAKIFSIGHVLRYSPHNMTLRDLLVEQQVIGEVVSIEHTEPVGWWHFSHSYVRGNWRRATSEGVGSLLTKSCHDVDFLLWLLCSPSRLTGDRPHLPTSITSHGSLTQFRKSRKPEEAGNATNCANCPISNECHFSAVKIYRDKWMREKKYYGWPVKIVCPEIEDIVRSSGEEEAEQKLMSKLREDYNVTTPDDEIASRAWYGRCVYEADNNVVDNQSVTINWEEDNTSGSTHGRGPKNALLHMVAYSQAQCDRRGRIYGTEGEIWYDSKTISVYTFKDEQVRTHTIKAQSPEAEISHGGGDWGLAGSFVKAIQHVDGGNMPVSEAQRAFVGCDLEECIRSHAVVFAAEDARMSRKVVNFNEWYQGIDHADRTTNIPT